MFFQHCTQLAKLCNMLAFFACLLHAHQKVHWSPQSDNVFSTLYTQLAKLCNMLAFFACLLHAHQKVHWSPQSDNVSILLCYLHNLTQTKVCALLAFFAFLLHAYTFMFNEIHYFICIMLPLSMSDSSWIVSAHSTIISAISWQCTGSSHWILFAYSSWIAGNPGSNWGIKIQSAWACSLSILNSISLPAPKLTLMDSLYSFKSSHGLMGVTYLTQVNSFCVGHLLLCQNTDVKCSPCLQITRSSHNSILFFSCSSLGCILAPKFPSDLHVLWLSELSSWFFPLCPYHLQSSVSTTFPSWVFSCHGQKCSWGHLVGIGPPEGAPQASLWPFPLWDLMLWSLLWSSSNLDTLRICAQLSSLPPVGELHGQRHTLAVEFHPYLQR